jgi:hypothetical protein
MGISFLTPALVGGAALVVVPIVLHLMMRRKPVKREFPALRFLRARSVANRRRLRLNHLLLLLARVAALALLALALARPVVRGAGWLADAEEPVAAVFVFDTAPRMDLREANRTRLEQAAAMARTLFEKLPPKSKVAVLDTAGGIAAFSPTLAAASARVSRLATATPALALSEAIAEGLRLLDGAELARHEIYVFTDGSRGAAQGPPVPDVAASHPETSLLWIDVGAKAPQNFGIVAVDLSHDRLPVGTPLVVTASLTRSGPEAMRAVAVEMDGADGRSTRRGVKPVAWKENAAGEATFEIVGLEPGVRQGRVVIDGTDDFSADDTRSFTVEVGAPARVLVAAPAPADSTGRFVSQAIAPAALVKAGRARFDAVRIDVDRLDATSWDGYQAIVLVDPPPLAPTTWAHLREWIADGHGLVVWLGPRATDAGHFNVENAKDVLGGTIIRVWRTVGDDNFLAPTALDHPLLAAFRRVGDAVPWQDFPVERHWEFAADTARPIVAYRNGLPAILEHGIGQGTCVVITTPVSQAADDPDAWNTLATGFEPWPFVILANETLLHAIDTDDDRNVIAGRPVVLHVDRRDVDAVFVRTPSGDDVPVAVDQDRRTITVNGTQEPGNYVVRAGGEVRGFAKGFSTALDSRATDYLRLAPDQMAAFVGGDGRVARNESELVRDVDLGRVGAELFGWLILLAAAAMAADWALANRFYAPRDDAADQPGAVDSFAALPEAVT